MKEFLKKHKKAVIIVTILLVAVAGIASCVNSAAKAGEEMLAAMMAYDTATVEKRTLVESLSATGTVTSLESESVTASVSGVDVLEVNVEVGDMVAAGDVLCTLDDTDIKQNLKDSKTSLSVTNEKQSMSLEDAQEALEDAKENLEDAKEDLMIANEGLAIWKDYLEKGTYDAPTCNANITRIEGNIKTYETQVENAEKSIENCEDNLKSVQLNGKVSGVSDKKQINSYEDQLAECTVTAPISGVVTAVNVKAGDSYMGSTIVTIEDISGFEVTAEIDEYDISKVHVGQSVVMKVNGAGETELKGTVTKVAPRATAGVGDVTYTVTMSIDTACEALKMDMTAKLSIILESKDNVLTVPYDAVQTDEEGNFYVEVVNESAVEGTNNTENTENQNEKVYVTKGIESDYYVEVISSNIEEGMTVVVPAAAASMTLEDLMNAGGPMGGM